MKKEKLNELIKEFGLDIYTLESDTILKEQIDPKSINDDIEDVLGFQEELVFYDNQTPTRNLLEVNFIPLVKEEDFNYFKLQSVQSEKCFGDVLYNDPDMFNTKTELFRPFNYRCFNIETKYQYIETEIDISKLRNDFKKLTTKRHLAEFLLLSSGLYSQDPKDIDTNIELLELILYGEKLSDSKTIGVKELLKLKYFQADGDPRSYNPIWKITNHKRTITKNSGIFSISDKGALCNVFIDINFRSQKDKNQLSIIDNIFKFSIEKMSSFNHDRLFITTKNPKMVSIIKKHYFKILGACLPPFDTDGIFPNELVFVYEPDNLGTPTINTLNRFQSNNKPIILDDSVYQKPDYDLFGIHTTEINSILELDITHINYMVDEKKSISNIEYIGVSYLNCISLLDVFNTENIQIPTLYFKFKDTVYQIPIFNITINGFNIKNYYTNSLFDNIREYQYEVIKEPLMIITKDYDPFDVMVQTTKLKPNKPKFKDRIINLGFKQIKDHHQEFLETTGLLYGIDIFLEKRYIQAKEIDLMNMTYKVYITDTVFKTYYINDIVTEAYDQFIKTTRGLDGKSKQP